MKQPTRAASNHQPHISRASRSWTGRESVRPEERGALEHAEAGSLSPRMIEDATLPGRGGGRTRRGGGRPTKSRLSAKLERDHSACIYRCGTYGERRSWSVMAHPEPLSWDPHRPPLRVPPPVPGRDGDLLCLRASSALATTGTQFTKAQTDMIVRTLERWSRRTERLAEPGSPRCNAPHLSRNC